jgi:hypothetical protein
VSKPIPARSPFDSYPLAFIAYMVYECASSSPIPICPNAILYEAAAMSTSFAQGSLPANLEITRIQSTSMPLGVRLENDKQDCNGRSPYHYRHPAAWQSRGTELSRFDRYRDHPASHSGL